MPMPGGHCPCWIIVVAVLLRVQCLHADQLPCSSTHVRRMLCAVCCLLLASAYIDPKRMRVCLFSLERQGGNAGTAVTDTAVTMCFTHNHWPLPPCPHENLSLPVFLDCMSFWRRRSCLALATVKSGARTKRVQVSRTLALSVCAIADAHAGGSQLKSTRYARVTGYAL